jgi:hypothetical protein
MRMIIWSIHLFEEDNSNRDQEDKFNSYKDDN